MILIEKSKVPLFAEREQVRGKFVAYYDIDGNPACMNFAPSDRYFACSICNNNVVTYHVDDRGQIVCSACGKFPKELLQT